jgi:NMD protein affecting ribosome stability and mRNA decay
MNAAKAWCHRCGAPVEDAPAPDRWVGNVTLICDDCRTVESTRAATPEHTGVAAS